MKNLLASLCFLCLLLFSFPACAQYKITASITVTNATTNGMVFTLNGNTRTFTNNVVNSASQVLTNSDVTGVGSKTNLLTQIQGTPFSQVTSASTGSNTFNLVGNADLPMAFTLTAGYASISYSTQLVAELVGVMVPVSALPTPLARTNVASGIVGAANAPENTNKIQQASLAASELMGTTNNQTVSGAKTFTNAASQFFGIISNSPAISGTIALLLGGTIGGTTLLGADFKDTNGVTRIEADSSGFFINGTNGANRLILANNYQMILDENGNSRFYADDMSVSLSDNLAINRFFAGANGTFISDTNGLFQFSADFNGASLYDQLNRLQLNANTNGISITNLTARGNASIAGSLAVSGATTLSGNVTFSGSVSGLAPVGPINVAANSDIAFTRLAITSLANGVNAGVPAGTNEFIEVSGPSAAFSIDGIANGRNGKIVTLVNQTGFQMTIANESGSDATAANRIRTLGSAANIVLTNSAVTLQYSSAASRWLVISHNP